MDKKSFILYSELIHTIKHLPDKDAGMLFKMILNYVNGIEYKTDDTLLKIAFEPIKQNLQRDHEKYEKYIQKQRDNGKRGGRPKKAKQTQKTQAFFSKPKKADNVNDNDNVNVNDNVNKDNKGDLVFPFQDPDFLNAWDQWKVYKKKEFKFSYKSIQSEQASLIKLSNIASNSQEAIRIINEAMAQSWKGFYKLKQDESNKINRQSRATIESNLKGWGTQSN